MSFGEGQELAVQPLGSRESRRDPAAQLREACERSTQVIDVVGVGPHGSSLIVHFVDFEKWIFELASIARSRSGPSGSRAAWRS